MVDAKKRRGGATGLAALGLCLALTGCEGAGRAPGQPGSDDEAADPRSVLSFDRLYGASCAGCHGAEGRGGAALGLRQPSYLALVSDAELRRVTAEGRPKTAMPAFARSAGGTLSDAQIDVLVAGIRGWAPAGLKPEPQAPLYAAEAAADSRRGAKVFQSHCGACHGVDGRGGKTAGSVVDDSFLELVSEQGLRTTIIAGRADLGCPDWQHDAGPPLSSSDVSDTVAWLLDQRPPFPGQPYPSPQADARK